MLLDSGVGGPGTPAPQWEEPLLTSAWGELPGGHGAWSLVLSKVLPVTGLGPGHGWAGARGPRRLWPWSLGVSSVTVWPWGLCHDRSSIFTQNLFGKMADILEKIKK